jgi:hypothetical protein
MEDEPDLNILDPIALSISVEKQHLKTKVSYILENPQSSPDQWGISTWSKKVARSSILKDGNALDISNLPEASCYNQPRQRHNPRQRGLVDLPRTRRRTIRPTQQEEEQAARGTEEPAAAAAGKLPNITVTAAAVIAQGEAIERAVREGMADEIQEHRRLTNLGRPDGHASESPIM